MCYNEDMNKQMSISFLHDEVNYTETADISGRKSGRMPSLGTSRAKKSDTSRIASQRGSRSCLQAGKGEQRRRSIKSRLYELRGFYAVCQRLASPICFPGITRGCPKPLHEKSAGCAFRIRIGHYFQF